MSNILDEFLDFEKTEKLFQREYLGVPYWQNIRYRIFYILFVEKRKEEIDLCNKKIMSQHIVHAADILKRLFFDLKNWCLIKQGTLLYMDQQNKRVVDKHKVDIYFDFWKFEEVCSVRRCIIGKDSNKYTYTGVGTAFPALLYEIAWALGKIKRKKQNDEDKYIKELCKKINEKFGRIVSEDELFKMVRRAIIYHSVYGKFYNRLLDKVKPKAIILKCYYSSFLFPLYNIAKEKHIPVIELQHGQISNHYAYNYGDVSEVGKEVPDYLFTYGDFWTKYISMPKSVKIIAVGSPFLDNRKKFYKGIMPDEKSIAIFSDLITGKGLEKIIIEFLKRNSQEGYKIYFKVAPEEINTPWREKYSALINNPSVEIVLGEKEVYELLAKAKHHVSVTSTVLYESLAFDTKRYIYEMHEILYVQPLVDEGLAQVFQSVEEFEKLLATNSDNYMSNMRELIWKSDAKSTGQEILCEIMNKM